MIELLAVIAVVMILCALAFPALNRAYAAGATTTCRSNLRQMQVAYTLYLADHDGRLFGFNEGTVGGSMLYYFGLAAPGSEGLRAVDKSKAKLAPYLGQLGGIETCPAFPYHASYFKQKFDTASYGYGINAYLLTNGPALSLPRRFTAFSQIARPADTIAWADAIQINTWQSPASPQNPLLEEWYYLDKTMPPKFHFRHNTRLNAIMTDGSVRSFAPARLDPRCDGLTGDLEPSGQDHYLRLVK